MTEQQLKSAGIKITISYLLLSASLYFGSKILDIEILKTIGEYLGFLFFIVICPISIIILGKKRDGTFWANFKYFGMIFLLIFGIFVYILTRSYWWR